MRVVLDASLNHVHPHFFAFADLLRRGRRSPYRGWFVVNRWPMTVRYRQARLHGSHGWMRSWMAEWDAQVGVPFEEVEGEGPPLELPYEAWYGIPTMPRVDLSHPEARGYMLEVARYWVAEHGIDGWRMDVARYVDPDFWPELRRVVRAANPEAYLLAEVMGDARRWLQGDAFDATMNYTFRQLVVRFLADETLDAAGFLDGLARLHAGYAWPVTLANQNLVSSHDKPRFLHLAGEELWRLELATVLQLLLPGAPSIYYGDEVGLSGPNDPGSRGAFPWQPDPAGHPLAARIRQLTALRRRHPALRWGSWSPQHAGDGVVAFIRSHRRQQLLVVVNRHADPRRLPMPAPGRLVWGSAEPGDGWVEMAGRAAAVLRL